MNKTTHGYGRRPSNVSSGFTLLEVLVALVIIALALGAATRASHMATDSTLIMKQRLMGGWVAENRLAELRTTTWPELGEKTGNVTQGGMQFTWRQTVATSPNPAFRRVEVKVYAGQNTEYAAATLVGYLADVK